MKTWIARQWIAMAEVFGWRIPSWVRSLVPADEFEQMLTREEDLTKALKSDAPREIPMPAFLETRIERAIVDTQEAPRRRTRWSGLLIPSSAFAMAVMVGFIMLSDRSAPVVTPEPQPELAVTETPVTVSSAEAMDRIGKGLSTLEKSLIVRPLAMEQDRLAADVTSALKFVSSSILPDAYADDVNHRLDVLRQGRGKSI